MFEWQWASGINNRKHGIICLLLQSIFNPCLDSDIYISDFDPDDDFLSYLILKIKISNSNIYDSKVQTVFMKYYSNSTFNIQWFSSKFEEFIANFVDVNLCAIGFIETWLP